MLPTHLNLLLLSTVPILASAYGTTWNKRDSISNCTKTPYKLNREGYYDHLDPQNFTVATVVKSP
jgi:hypothetical protein